MPNRRGIRGWLYPVTIWLVLLGGVFATEYSLMLILPLLLPEHSSRLLESAADAIVLTLLLAPILWWVIVRPLRENLRLRAQFLADLFSQMECDRRQTAYELHDGVGQALTLLISGLRSVKKCRANLECSGRVDGFQNLAENALTEVRRLALGLRPSLLDDLGLAPALERLVEDTRHHYPGKISFMVDGIHGLGIPDQIATTVFRIAQEALTNAIKHSHAQQVSITAQLKDGKVVLEVRDNGCGIQQARLRGVPIGHLGVRGMRERAVLVGGTFAMDSTQGQGVSIRVTIPTGVASHE